MHFKQFKKNVIGLVLAISIVFAPIAAEASIPTFRLDSYKEGTILAVTTEIQNYIKDILTNLDGIKSIMGLVNLVKDFQNTFESFNIESLVGGIKDSLLNSMNESFNNTMKTKDIGGCLQTGEMDGKQLDSSGVNLSQVLMSGGVDVAAQTVTTRIKRIIEETFKLPATDGPDKEADQKKAAEEAKKVDPEKETDKDAAENATKKAIEVAKEAVPLSFSGMVENAAVVASDGNTQGPRAQLYALTTAESVKNGAIQEITKVLAPYTANKESKASYRYGINKIREQSQKALNKAADQSKGGPSEALKTMAALSAVMVEQQGLQNELLVSLTDVLADDIKMTGLTAMYEIEGYSNNVQNNINRYIDIYNSVNH